MTLWIALVVLCFMALGFVIWPLYRSSGRLTPLLATTIVLVAGLSAGLYHKIGQPGVPSGAGSMPDSDKVVASLARRLEESPDDVNGWILLGRSYQSLQEYDNASSAFEKALALEPGNPNALFYGGDAAASRGDMALAADRWEALLRQDTPPEVREMLQRNINEWRGRPSDSAETVPVQSAGSPIVSINLTLSEEAENDLPADGILFVVARDPAQPSPPIAVKRRSLSELPVIVELSDTDAMIAARPLSGFAEIEVVARVSLTGSPAAQPGDWSGSLIVVASNGQTVDLVIDQKTP